jgi:hypothetical protein
MAEPTTDQKKWWSALLGGDSKDNSFSWGNIAAAAVKPTLEGIGSFIINREAQKDKERERTQISPLEQAKLDLSREELELRRQQLAQQGGSSGADAALGRARLALEAEVAKAKLMQEAMQMQADAIKTGRMAQAGALQNVIENLRTPLLRR